MTLSRRQFVGMGGLVVASAIAPLEAANKALATGIPSFNAAQEIPLQYMSADTFRPHIGTRFQVHASPRPVFLTLIAVDDETKVATPVRGLHVGMQNLGRNPSASTTQTETYALRFRGQPGTALSQGTYVFEGGVGKIALFIVPAGPPRRGMRVPTYTAIICHVPR
ncbi:MAG TPA: hypothetical protein VK738_09385 [Terriglobales bacterium]|jgi:hypothetical protein|nr:hypothetical protein [Terriglobales bacterium]